MWPPGRPRNRIKRGAIVAVLRSAGRPVENVE
jgi:hypothetical protein